VRQVLDALAGLALAQGCPSIHREEADQDDDRSGDEQETRVRRLSPARSWPSVRLSMSFAELRAFARERWSPPTRPGGPRRPRPWRPSTPRAARNTGIDRARSESAVADCRSSSNNAGGSSRGDVLREVA
jgi:hypothetical protein